ncbi:hypothetical protein D3C73_877190 [compost metagenome]
MALPDSIVVERTDNAFGVHLIKKSLKETVIPFSRFSQLITCIACKEFPPKEKKLSAISAFVMPRTCLNFWKI